MFNGKDHVLIFSSINNISDVPVAYIISISEAKGYEGFSRKMHTEIILVTLLSVFIIIFGLILAIYQKRLKNSAELDYLTKIYNRNKFYTLAEIEFRNSKDYEEESFIILLDIDFFKNINDTYGHEWGDKVIIELVRKISKNIRSTDIFARWGGEEFLILMPNLKKNQVIKRAEELRYLIEKSNSKELKDVTVSIGVSSIDYENYDIDDSINKADEAMYCAKNNGRNQVCFK